MTLDFTEVTTIGGKGENHSQFTFYKRSWVLGGSATPSYKDIILSGIGSLTLVNAKEDSLNYLKLFGGTEQVPETYIDSVTLDGKCEQDLIPTPSPQQPMDIWCNNGAIKYSANMANVNEQTVLVGYYISAQGVVGPDRNNWTYQDFISVSPNTTYTLTMSSSVYFVSISEYSTNNDSGFIVRKTGDVGTNTTLTITTEANTNFIRFGANINRNIITLEDVLAINWMLNKGNSMPYTPYSPTGIYTDGTQEVVTDNIGNTASAEMLLAVGDYKDTQEVLSGAVTRNVGIKVLDGSESWTPYGSGNCWASSNLLRGKVFGNALSYCTHYDWSSSKSESTIENNSFMLHGTYRLCIKDDRFQTDTAFKQYLADQYANGTPVIVVYPTSSATTETVSGQVLNKEPVTVTGSLAGLVANVVSSSHTTPKPTQPLDIVANNGVIKVSPNLVEFNETRINSSTWASADKTRGFEVYADVYNKTVGASLFSNANCFGVYVPCALGESVSLNFFDYTPMGSRCFYCEVTEDGKCNTTPIQFASSNTHEITQSSFTITQSNSIGFVFEWWIDSQQTRNYTASNYMIVRGSTQPTNYMPYGQIYYDGTVETVGVYGNNIFNKNDTDNLGSWHSSSLTISQASSNATLVMKAIPNATYYYKHCSVTGGGRAFYTEVEDWEIGSDCSAMVGSTTIDKNKVRSITVSANAKWVFFLYGRSGQTETFEEQLADYMVSLTPITESTPYEPYFNGGTATAQPLLAVGNYKDVQSVLDGEVTRNVGVKVLDGSELWEKTSVNNLFYLHDNTVITNNAVGSNIPACICSYFKGELTTVSGANQQDNSIKVGYNGVATAKRFVYLKSSLFGSWTANQLKQWLADQYNAGHPVIVVYPLEEPTTETVTGQPLTIQAGTNVVAITQASIDNLELEVSYKAGVEVTVEEIEAVNNDESVEVTING